MHRSVIVVPFAAALALSGCGKKQEASASGGEAAGGNVASGMAAAAVIPDAGLYEIKMDLIDMSMPGMPAGMAEQMKKSMATARVTKSCLTEADRADAVKKMTKGAENGACKYTKYDVIGGKVDARMECDMGDRGTGTYTMTGTITRQGVDMTMQSDQKSPQMPGGGMSMKMHLTSTRVGDCKG